MTIKKTKLHHSKHGVVSAAVDAVVELGHAAESLQESFRHIKKAKEVGRPAATRVARTARRTGTAIATATKHAIKRVGG